MDRAEEPLAPTFRLRSDQDRVSELNDVAWIDSNRSIPAPPGRKVSSAMIFLTLVECGGATGAAATELGISAHTLRRRMEADPKLRSMWAEVAPRYRKAKATKRVEPSPPKHLRLCTPQEIEAFDRAFEQAAGLKF